MSWIELLAERRIAEAMESGGMDTAAGQPIDGLDQPYDPMWWVKNWIKRERLSPAQRHEHPPADEHRS